MGDVAVTNVAQPAVAGALASSEVTWAVAARPAVALSHASDGRGPGSSAEALRLAPPAAVAGSALAACWQPLDLVSGDPVEIASQLMARSRDVETKHALAMQQAHATSSEAKMAEHQRAVDKAREAAEDAGFWGTVADVAAIVGVVAGVAASAFTGGASLALAGVAAGCALGSRYSGDIAKALCGNDSAAARWLELTLGVAFAAGSVASGCGAGSVAAAGAKAASSTAQAVEATVSAVRGSAQIVQSTAKAGQGVRRFGAAHAQITAERAKHQAEGLQERREELIDALRDVSQGHSRDQRRVSEMLQTVAQTRSFAVERRG